ncbi:MAG: transglycosylase SLT domain-containing protein, partial [Myxococcales bacterium]|nr:transglycosylase SLT domain-containing protein [Myxococcales bacterium]
RLDLMIALCDAATGAWKDAAAGFDRARAGLPVLSDWIGYQQARALYFAHRTGDALERARAIATDSIVGADAALLIGDLLRAGKDPAATAAHYRAYLTDRPDGIRRSEARYRLAEALEADDATAHRDELVAAYRAITIDDPLSSWATKATARLAAIGKDLDDAERARLAIDTRTATEELTRAEVLFDAMRNPESEAGFTAALAAPDLTVAQRCVATYNRAQSRFKARDRKQAAPWFDDAIDACKAAGDTDLEIRAAYQAGRSYAYLHDHETAIARYRHAQEVDPAHSFDDDALLREAEEWADLGKDAEVEKALASLPDKFPQGDMRAEAMWRLGWKAWRDHDTKAAMGWWKKQIDVMPIDDNYWAEGQAQYWLGRGYQDQQDLDQAATWWEACVRTYPMGYYAALALNRLRETRPQRFDALVDEISAAPKGFDADAPAFAFKPRPEYATPGFARAIELLRLGLGEPAEAELRVLGLVAPPGKHRVDDPDLAEKLWAMAFLYDRAGRYATSHWPTRWHILDYRRQWPVGANRARWEIAYPKAFWDLLTRHAALNHVPIAMQIAIVREESAFDPLMESYANAIGLTQMIHVTAERFAKGTGIDPTRDNLRDPEKNVTIGSRFLGFLFAKWDDFTMLVPPSYNAGEGAVKKWLRLRGTWDTDEFIEAIVDDQARNYSKRVLGSFFTYTWLYDQTVPDLPNRIPAKLLPDK